MRLAYVVLYVIWLPFLSASPGIVLNMFVFFPQERQRQLESLGISLQSSGIRVVDDKCFLVNLNADPALNELLVYYLKVTCKRSS